jgi:hypothetical protein
MSRAKVVQEPTNIFKIITAYRIISYYPQIVSKKALVLDAGVRMDQACISSMSSMADRAAKGCANRGSSAVDQQEINNLLKS